MEDLVEKLQREKAQLLSDLLEIEDNDSKRTEARLQQLKAVFEELELVAAAATPFADDVREPINPNPNVLTGQFYASYLLVVLLSTNLNDARFLWKRIDSQTKNGSEPLRNVWEIGKALWQRDYTAAYAAMNKAWPNDLDLLVGALRESTRESMAGLLSVAYSSISIGDAVHALGFTNETSLVEYCQSLGWTVSSSDHLVHPKPLPHAPSRTSSLDQLETLSRYVLHLEQSTLVNLS